MLGIGLSLIFSHFGRRELDFLMILISSYRKKNVKQSLNEQMDAKMYDWLPKFLHAFSLCLAKFSAFENTTEELSN